MYVVLILGCLLLFAGCGSDESQAPETPTQSPDTSVPAETPEGTPTENIEAVLLYTSPSPRDQRGSRMPSSA